MNPLPLKKSYLIGLWFSLRTHASQIWQNPQQLLHPSELPSATGQQRHPLYHRLVHGSAQRDSNLDRKSSNVTNLESNSSSRSQTPVPRVRETFHGGTPSQKQAPDGTANQGPPVSPSNVRRVSYASHVPQQAGYTPLLETVGQAVSSAGLQPMHLPEHMTTDEFTRAVAVATVSALRQQQTRSNSPLRVRASGITTVGESEGGGHGGHDAPSWSRTTSASVLLVCTALYAAIAGTSLLLVTSTSSHICMLRNTRGSGRCRS
jgi:Ca2+:H+ antiporter